MTGAQTWWTRRPRRAASPSGSCPTATEVLYQRADVALYASKQSTDGVVLADAALGRDGRPPSDADSRGASACGRAAGG